MLSEKKRRAAELLFEDTETEVAKKVKVSLDTLVHWIEELEFREMLNGQMKGYQRATNRLLSRLYVECCRELNHIIHDREDKSRHKVALDLLKAGGILREGPLEERPEEESVDEIIARLSMEGEERERVKKQAEAEEKEEWEETQDTETR